MKIKIRQLLYPAINLNAARTLTLSLLLVLPLLASQAAYAGNASKEDLVKAAYLYQFSKFIKWPEDPGLIITIGVIGDEPMASEFGAMDGKLSQGKSVVFMEVTSLEELRDCCDLIYIDSIQDKLVDDVLNTLSASPVLTVNDTEHFIQQGGMIRFIRKGTKLKFQVNLESAQQAGLKISSEMLKAAINSKI